MPKPIPTSEARRRISEIAEAVAFHGQRFVLQRHGKPVVALISADDLAKLETLEEVLDLDSIRKSLADPGEDLSWRQLHAELVQDRPPRS